MALPGTRTFLLPGSTRLIISCQQAQWPAASHVQNYLNVDLKRPVVKDLGTCAPSPVPVSWGWGWEEWHVAWLLDDGEAAAAPASAAVLPLDAGHQLLLGVVICDGRLPLGVLVAAAWGPVGEKHRHGKQDVTFKLHISTGQLQLLWMEF